MCPAGNAAAVALWRKTLKESVAEGRGGREVQVLASGGGRETYGREDSWDYC